jgi:hypothetical protein
MSSVANARGVPRNMLRGIWSSSRHSATQPSGLSSQFFSSPAAARVNVSPKQSRIA